MSHLIKIYAVCKFSFFRLWYLKSKTLKSVEVYKSKVSIDFDEVAHYEPPHQNLCYLQIQLFLSLVVRVNFWAYFLIFSVELFPFLRKAFLCRSDRDKHMFHKYIFWFLFWHALSSDERRLVCWLFMILVCKISIHWSQSEMNQ